ncbi:GLUT4 regulating protein TUG-domain-containing protein [Triangularia verruculosa]|uniref:GLUT4 regulating protein TUG-domain-containing protein n=1 Tax=Triangularia verruculosa TaxID=2587418 RepID=A0AAN6XGG2_9PEZI|nr:GLUT4 regulating protein TUG-domain-containing protein [Triangularia verruculosa]
MSAHVEVVSTDLRRAKVKVTPGTYLVDVLNEACKKLNINADKYELKYKQKTVDLTGPFRTSRLGPGAKLELVQKSKSASVVSIALDVGGKRYTKKLPNDMTLWQTLRQFESSENDLNLTGRGAAKDQNGGQLYHEAPFVNIMGREYSALEDLNKTLSQCGINSGSMVLRLTFKITEKTLFEAMSDIGQFLKDVEPDQPKPEEAAPAPATEESKTESGTAEVVEEPKVESNTESAVPEPAEATGPVVTTEEETKPPGDPMDVDETQPQPTSQSPPAETIDRLIPTSVFVAPTSTTPAAVNIQEDDSVYEPTIAHAQLRQKQLLQKAQNTRLKSDAELAAIKAEEEAKLARVTKVEIKVRFPDQTSATWTATPEETGAWLYQAIRATMAHPDQPFKLVIPGPRTHVEDSGKKLIGWYKLKGPQLFNLIWEDGASADARKGGFLKESIASKAREIVIPEVPQDGGVGEGSSSAAGPSSSSQPASDRPKRDIDPEALKKKMGKFFKFGKK